MRWGAEDAAFAEGLEKCAGKKLSQIDVVDDRIMKRKNVVVARVDHEILLNLEELSRRNESSFWNMCIVCPPTFAIFSIGLLSFDHNILWLGLEMCQPGLFLLTVILSKA